MLVLLFLSAVLFSQVFGKGEDCNDPKTQCDPCQKTMVDQEVDFIFVIDASWSMQPAMRGVGKGLSAFHNALKGKAIDPLYFVVLEGQNCTRKSPNENPEVLVHASRNHSELDFVFKSMTANNAKTDVNQRHGGIESQFEAVQMALHEAGYDKNGYAPGTGVNVFNSVRPGIQSGIKLAIRENSTKFIFLVSDEDDDPPYFKQNRPVGMPCGECPRGGSTHTNDTFPSSGFYVTLRDNNAKALIKHKAFLYMFTECSKFSKYNRYCQHQYGVYECDKSSADLTNFNATQSYECLQNLGLHNSVSGQMLKAGLVARHFDIGELKRMATTSNTDFINEVFTEAVTTISGDCTAKKRDVEDVEAPTTCYSYTCEDKIGCVTHANCIKGCANCNIKGFGCVINGASHPNDTCKFCNYNANPTDWTECKGPSPTDPCMQYECSPTTATCNWRKPICTKECQRCEIEGFPCMSRGTQNPDNRCLECHPETDFQNFTRVCNCTRQCANGGSCVPSGDNPQVGVCECASGWGGAGCEEAIEAPVEGCPEECQTSCIDGVCQDKESSGSGLGLILGIVGGLLLLGAIVGDQILIALTILVAIYYVLVLKPKRAGGYSRLATDEMEGTPDWTPKDDVM